jgi:GxxExxY protein
MGFPADILVAGTVRLEIKAALALPSPQHAQLLSYPRMSGLPVGLPINFHAMRLKDGLNRFAGHPAASSVALSGPPASSVFGMEDE